MTDQSDVLKKVLNKTIKDRYERLSFNVFHSLTMWQEIIRQSNQVTSYLKSFSQDWIKTYFPWN